MTAASARRISSGWRKVLAAPEPAQPPDLRRIARQFRHFDAIAVRFPALPYAGTSEHCFIGARHEPSDASARFAKECLHVANLCKDPFVQEAIYVASPSLHAQLRSAKSESGPLPLDVTLSALRYLARMSSRCTPFGLFAGIASGRVGPETILRHPQADAIVPHVRLDAAVVHDALSWVLGRDSMRHAVALRANNTYSQLNRDNARYVETSRNAGGLVYALANVEPSPHVAACIAHARAFPGKTAQELAAFVVQFDGDVSLDEALEFVLGLVDAQLLVPAIAPAVTSRDALSELLAHEGVVSELPALRQVQQAIERIDRRGLSADRMCMQEVEAALSVLPFETKAGRALQVDAHFPSADVVLGEATVQSICEAVFPYYVASYQGRSGGLERFKTEFVKRFGTNEVSLALALDEESGVRFDGYVPSETAQRAAEATLLKRLVESAGNAEIVLSDDDIVAMSASVPHRLPGTLSVHAALTRAGEGIDVQLKGIVAPGGAQLLGRFAFASPSIEQLVGKMIAAEEAAEPQRIFAEIVHVPAGRIGNVISRPAFRRYEIPYVNAESGNCAHALPLSDLLVSVVQDRIVLRSTSLGKEVLPRLSCAHNYFGNNLSAYQFLSSLQQQDGGSFAFSWGRSFDVLDRLPRLRYRNCVFAPARWRVHAAFASKLKAESKRGLEAALAWLRVERERRGIPRMVQIEEFDNTLIFDLDSPLSVILLADALNPIRHPYLVEALLPQQCPAQDAHGDGYACEIVLPLRTDMPRTDRDSAPGPAPVPAAARAAVDPPRFEDIVSPGGEVVFLKIYGGEKSLDSFAARELRRIFSVLTEIAPLQMFYVRYTDSGGYHLRIRFLSPDVKRLWSDVVPALLEQVGAVRERYLLRDVSMDTYARETARYGGPGRMAICETIFAIDSLLTLDALELVDTTHQSIPRWRYAVLIAHIIAANAFTSLEDRLHLFDELFVGFGGRGPFSREAVKADYAAMHRARRQIVDAILFEPAQLDSLESAWLERNGAMLSQYSAAIRALNLAPDDPRDLSILASIVHMSMNRLFIINANQEEAIVYYLLVRALESRLARDLGSKRAANDARATASTDVP